MTIKRSDLFREFARLIDMGEGTSFSIDGDGANHKVLWNHCEKYVEPEA
jgi:hypothetical protein